MAGRRVLAVTVAWPLLAAALIAGTLLGPRTFDGQWAAAHAADLAAACLAEAYLVLMVVLLAVFGGPAGLRDRLGFRVTRLWHLVLALATWGVSLTLGGVLTFALSPLFGKPTSNAADVLSISRDPVFVALVVPTVALLAPACEELLFRGVLFGWLRTRVPLAAAVVLSAAVFAGLHLIVPLLPVLFVFGVATALVYEATGSTLNSFVMHATQNSLAVAVTYLALSGATR